MRRGIAATALVAALAMTTAACGGDDGGTAGNDQGSKELSGTVTYWDTSNEAEKGTYQALAEGFTKLHPKVKVTYVNVPFGEANAKFKNAAGGNSGAPDVMRTEVAWVADFASLGYLAPLDGTRAVDNEKDWLPQAAASTKYDGKTYATPQVIDTMALFYNKKMLKDAGVEPPRSITELKAASAKISAKDPGKTGLYLRGDDPYWFLSFLYGEGGDMVDAKDKKITVGDQAGVKAYSVIKDLVDSKAAITDAADGWNNMQNAFKSGKVAMMLNGPWAIADSRAGAEFKDPANLGIAPVPAGSVKQGSPQGGWNLSVYAGSKNLNASYEFAKYMSSAQVQQQTTEKLSLLPTRTSVYAVPSVAGNEMVKFFKPAVDKAVERPWIPQGNSLFEPIRLQMANVLTGKTAPDKAASATADGYRKLLKDYK
ncbi:extracellular solute-binding protein [Streptomyces sp. NPDC001941]|uniref:extracellular solute-binding protein n=1 Tax=Streptomyces sp. NPDC001941 TaxID=3154659 RepID=UPI00331B4E78